MTPESLLAELRDHGIITHADGDRIRLDAPPGAMTPGLLSAVKSFKSELLELFPETANASKADAEFDRFERVAVPARDGGLRDPAEPILQRGVSGERWDSFIADCARLGKAVRA